MIKAKIIPNIKPRLSSAHNPETDSEEANICLNCPRPVCKPNMCKRYEQQLKELKQKHKIKRFRSIEL